MDATIDQHPIDKHTDPDAYYQDLWDRYQAGEFHSQKLSTQEKEPKDTSLQPYFDKTERLLQTVVHRMRRNEGYIPDHSSTRVHLNALLRKIQQVGSDFFNEQ
jgi:hypothetical protein